MRQPKGRGAVFHMCGGCAGGSIPSCFTRAFRFSMFSTAWEPSRVSGNEKPMFFHTFSWAFRMTFAQKSEREKAQRSRGPDNGARWQSGSEQRLTCPDRRVCCWVAPIRSQPDGTQTDSNCDTTESDAAQSCTERTGSLPQLTLRAEKAGALCDGSLTAIAHRRCGFKSRPSLHIKIRKRVFEVENHSGRF